MPYEFQDHVKNPYILLLLASVAAAILGLSRQLPWWSLLIIIIAELCVAFKLKRMAVSHCLEVCVKAHADVIKSQDFDLVVG